jgi:hypothetical protein
MSGRKKASLLAIAGFAVILTVLISDLLFWPSLSYQGKPIEEWMGYFDRPSGLAGEALKKRIHKEAEAGEAVRQMVPNVFPYLRRMLRRDSSVERTLRSIRELFGGETVSEENRMRRAIEACTYLGPQGRPMIPDLLQCMKNSPYRNVRSRAAYALGEIGGSSGKVVPALAESLKSRPDGNVLIALGKYGSEAKSTVLVIVELLDGMDENGSSYEYILCESARALHRIDPNEAEKLLPRLKESLENNPDSYLYGRLNEIVKLISTQDSE